MPNIILSILYALTYLIFEMTFWGKFYYYSHFKGKYRESQSI